MTKKLTLIFLTLSILGVISYKLITTPIPLTGQVFIVTKGAQNIKLGLAEINLIPEKDMFNFIENKKREFLTIKSNKVENELTPLLIEYFQAGNKALKEIESIFPLLNKPSKIDNQLKVADKIRYEYDALKDKIDLIKKSINSPPTEEYLYSGISSLSVAKTLTDAEGKFTIQIPPFHKFCLAAHSSRQTLEDKEDYYWMVLIPEGNNNINNFILSNNNLLFSDDSISVINTKILFTPIIQ